MVGVSPARSVTVAFAVLAIAVAIIIGAHLRLKDPLSSEVLPAEDTFTHMAYVQKHLADGKLDPQNPGGTLYPPGTHTLLAAIWVYTGLDLHDVMRFGPVLFGIVGILGAAIFVWYYEGAVGGVVAAFAAAVGQELIRRTTMMAPTAVDVALLPFAFLAIIETMRGRLAWGAGAAALMLFFVYSHPWLVTIVCLAAGVFTIFGLLAPWNARAKSLTAAGVALVMVVLGISWSLSLSGCAGVCGPGFKDVIPDGERLNALAPIIALAAIGLAALTFLARKKLDPLLNRPDDAPSLLGRIFMCVVIAIAILVITVPASLKGFPQYVEPVKMFGYPTLVLATIGLVLTPFIRGPASYLGAALTVATWPFVIYNPFNSPFWSHRTAVYFGVAAVILAGVAAAAIARVIAQSLETQLATNPRYRANPARPLYAVFAMLLVALALSGVTVASAPKPHDTAWYRLYGECEQNALHDIADAVAGRNIVIITGDWQSLLVLSAISEPTTTIWLKGGFYVDQKQRDDMYRMSTEGKRPVLVIVDKHTKKEIPHANTEALKYDPWEEYARWCTHEPGNEIIVYNAKGARP